MMQAGEDLPSLDWRVQSCSPASHTFSNYEYVCADEKFNSEVVPSNSLTGECSRVPLLATSHLGWVTPPHANLSLPMINARKHKYTQTNMFIFFLTTPPLTMQDINLWPLVMLMKAAKQPNRFEVPSLVSESTTGWEKMARV